MTVTDTEPLVPVQGCTSPFM